jgi:hypothetical protein
MGALLSLLLDHGDADGGCLLMAGIVPE